MQTISQFIKTYNIRSKATRTGSNSNSADVWGPGSRHWLVTLERLDDENNVRATMEVPFSQGSGHTNAPTAADVLDCLASDVQGVENTHNFEDWAGEYGYDTDSRKAEAIYKTCLVQAKELKSFLSGAAYKELLDGTERL